MNSWIALLSGVFLLPLYYWGNRHRLSQTKAQMVSSLAMFTMILVFISFWDNPVSPFWMGWLLCLYVLYDDLCTKSLLVELPILATLYFFLLTGEVTHLLSSLLAFLFLFLLSYFSKEKLIKEGDAYGVLPLTFFLSPIELPTFFYLSFLLGGVILTGWYLYEVRKKEEPSGEYPFLPFFTLSAFFLMGERSSSLLPTVMLCLTLLFFFCYVLLLFARKKKY